MVNDSSGMNVTKTNATMIAIKKGMSFFVTVSIDCPLILQPTNKAAPTGGVVIPTQRLNIIIIPKCIGSMPICTAIGRKIGVKINRAGVKSMNIPTISNITFMISKIMTGL